MAREVMEKGSMRYSQRLAMLKAASAMGLGRFEANLILAIEQNRQQPMQLEGPSRNWSGIVTFLTIALLQSLILAGVWWIAHA
jgi:hypothetical protein